METVAGVLCITIAILLYREVWYKNGDEVLFFPVVLFAIVGLTFLFFGLLPVFKLIN